MSLTRTLTHFIGCLFIALLGACDSRPAATSLTSVQQPEHSVGLVGAIEAKALLPAHRPPADTLDVSNLDYAADNGKAKIDTMLSLGSRHYRLQLQAKADSNQELRLSTAPADSVMVGTTANGKPVFEVKRFYNVRYTITLRDSAGRPHFQRTFTKPEFYAVVGRELVLASEPLRPAFVGFNAPRQWLLFRQQFGVDGTDWGGEAFLALDLKGRTQRLTFSNIYGGGGSDCRIQQSPDGQAVITCNQLLLPGGRYQPLTKPHTQLVAARFLSDTTLLTIYEYVFTRRVQYEGIWGKEEVPDPRYRRVPNAFVLSARTGRVLAKFRYDGFVDALGYNVLRQYVWQANSYYLLDENQQLVRVIPKSKPQLTYQVSLRQLPAFRAPRQRNEVKIILSAGLDTSALYLNTVTRRMRYHAAVEQD
jgi:hypothetical protein